MQESQHPVFEVVTTTAGAISIRNKVLNEIMHNPVGPWAEANALYIDQTRLKSRLCDAGKSSDEFVIFDVGLGAAANALAVLHCAKSCGAKNLRLVSFERDLELLSFALSNANLFDHFIGYESILQKLLNDGEWRGHGIHWILRKGDFKSLIEDEIYKPHIILYDPYSPQVNQDMWTASCFRKVFQKCRTRTEGGSVLFTYSQSTPIRVAMFDAGFYVGHGQSTGLKNQTTQAATSIDLLDSPLELRWLNRWKNSRSPYPFDCHPTDQQRISNFIVNHPQFFDLK